MSIDRAEALRQRLARQHGVSLAAATPRSTLAEAGNLSDAFAVAVAAHGNRTAVRCDGVALSYRDLDTRVAELAGTLRDRGAGAGTLVGVLLDRSIEMVVAALAVVRAGAAYVPIDPATPAARVGLILTDAAPALVITSRRLADRAGDGVATLLVDEPHPAGTPVLDCPSTRDSRAYVIFTSGTTGRPKGVQVSHGNVLRLFTSTEAAYGFCVDDVWSLFHSFAFDFSVWELWGPLLYGGCLVVVPSETAKSPAAFRSLLRDEGVTVLNQTPTAFTQLITEDVRHADRLPLRHVVFGGEALRFGDLAPWVAKYGETAPRLVNMYGITETTVHASYRPVRQDDLTRQDSPIGAPLSDLDFVLVDEGLNPVPAGQAGEIVVTGPGVSLGYLNRPELTAERFVTIRGERGYRSGDLAVRTATGEHFYHGRRDDQVKIRGFRIELGEVECAVCAVPGLAQAAVVVRDLPEHGPSLVAYVVPESGALTAVAIRQRLAEVLPAYMVPARIEFLDAMPMNGNGKLDRAALPVLSAGATPVAASTLGDPVTDRVHDIVAGLLGERSVSTTTDFFALGGHSLLATRVLAGVRAAFGVDVSLREFLRTPTVLALADAVRTATAATVQRTALLALHHNEEPMPFVVSIPGALGFGQSFAQLSAVMPDRAWSVVDLADVVAARSDLTLPALVADIAALVANAAAGRPVHVVGHSLGGTLGFALVPALRAIGQEVASLVLLDAADPALLAEELAESRGYRRWEYLMHVATVFPAAAHRWPGALPTDSDVPADEVVALAESLLGSDVADLFTNGLVSAFHGYLRLADLRWPPPEPLFCPTLLVQATRRTSLANRQAAGWEPLLPGSLTCRDIDASHVDMIQAPHATVLAALMTEFFAETERPSHRKAS